MVTVQEHRNRLHPHKFTLWIAIGSIIMMFAGLTSALIVKRNQAKWEPFSLPVEFWYSTAAILLSSLLLYLSLKTFRQRDMSKYRNFLIGALILGLVFMVLQFMGFKDLWDKGVTLKASVSYSFLYVIVGLHALHVLGGIVALVVLSVKAFDWRVKRYDSIPLEVAGTYWHFVDLLWVYLLIFLVIINQ